MEDRRQVPLTVEGNRDINWFMQFLPRFNGITIFYQRPISAKIELDASLQRLGARRGDQIYSLVLPLGYTNFQIVHL